MAASGPFQPESSRFDGHFGWNRTISVVLARIGPNWSELVGFGLNWCESKKEKEKRKSNWRIECRMPRQGESGAGATTLKLHLCFLEKYH